MTKAEKLLEKARNNPKSVTFDDLDKLLDHAGFVRRQPKGGSSHYFYSHPEFPEVYIVVPRQIPFVLEVYVRRVLKLLDGIGYSGQKGKWNKK